jgi:RNA polymerase sigma factor (TIGR02999 family)
MTGAGRFDSVRGAAYIGASFESAGSTPTGVPRMQLSNAPLTQLLQLAAQGERAALDRVFAALYPDLQQIARARLRKQGRISHLETTALVHESFLRLVNAAELTITDRKHFFTYAAKTMRNIIIELAREHLAQRRGGEHGLLRLDTEVARELSGPEGDVSLIALNDALQELECVDPALAQVVELRYFAGYSEIEIADMTGSSERTVRRQWEKARAFLIASLQDESG